MNHKIKKEVTARQDKSIPQQKILALIKIIKINGRYSKKNCINITNSVYPILLNNMNRSVYIGSFFFL